MPNSVRAPSPALAPALAPSPLPRGAELPRAHAQAAYGAPEGRPPMISRRQRVRELDLDCPYIAAMHPAAEHVHEATVAWAQAMGLANTPTQVESLRESQIGHLVARVFPAAIDLTGLQIAVDWTTLFFCLDDHLENNIHGAVLAAAYLRVLLGVFRDGARPRLMDAFTQAFYDLRERMLELRVPNWIPRFAACVERLFNGFVDEAKYRLTAIVPELHSYRKNRRNTVGLYTVLLVAELTDGGFLPPEVSEHPAVQELESVASNLVGLANDIFTVDRELARGEVNNTVLVLMHQEGLDLEAARALAIELHNAEMREFARRIDELPRFDPDTDAQLQRHVEILTSFVSGHRDWAVQTGRYRGAEAEVDDE